MQDVSAMQPTSMPQPMPMMEQQTPEIQAVPMPQVEAPPPVAPESYSPVYASNPVEASNLQGSLATLSLSPSPDLPICSRSVPTAAGRD